MKRVLACTAVLLLALGLAFAAFSPRPAVASLPLVEDAQMEETLANATAPIGVLVTGENCASCPAAEKVLAGASARHSQMTFIKVVDAVTEPAFLVIVPGLGPAFQLDKFNPTAADIDTFLNKRVQVATAEQAVISKLMGLKSKMETTAKPFDEQLAAIKAKAEPTMAPFNTKLAELSAKAAAAAKAHTDEAAALEQKLEAVEKPFNDQAADLQTQIEAAVKPFKDKAAPIEKLVEPAVKDIIPQMQAAQKAGDKEAFLALQAKLKEALGSHFEEMQSIEQGVQAAVKPLANKLNALAKQAEAATAVLKVQIDTAKLNAKLETMPFKQEIQDTRHAAESAAAAFKAEATPIMEARTAALQSIAAEIQKLSSELEAIVAADMTSVVQTGGN